MPVRGESIFGASPDKNALKAETQPAPVLRPDSGQYQEAVISLSKMITAQAVDTDAAVRLLRRLSAGAAHARCGGERVFPGTLDVACESAVIDQASTICCDPCSPLRMIVNPTVISGHRASWKRLLHARQSILMLLAKPCVRPVQGKDLQSSADSVPFKACWRTLSAEDKFR